jgi:hypothetical protein
MNENEANESIRQYSSMENTMLKSLPSRFVFLCFVGLFSLLSESLSRAVPLRYIPKLQDGIRIDGTLDESCYADTQPVENFKIAGRQDQTAPSTRAWVFWTEEKMVFAFQCVDHNIAAKPRSWDDMAVAPQDRVEFYLWCGNEEDAFISFEIAPLGAVLDYRAKYYRYLNFGWTPETLNYAVSLTADGYCMEAELYQKDLSEAKIQMEPGARFRAGLFRSEVKDLQENVEPTWITWVDASEPFPDFHIPRSLGEFVLEDETHPGPMFGRFGYWEISEKQVNLRPKPVGESMQMKISDTWEGWRLQWIGRMDENAWALVEGKDAYVWLSDECRILRITKPAMKTISIDSAKIYGGRSAGEILASPRDILGERILEKDKIDPEEIASLLPPLVNGYQILGSPLTGGVSPNVMRNGEIRLGDRVLFDPAAMETRLGDCQSQPGLLDGWMPISHYRFSQSTCMFELSAFVPVWERGTSPSVWIRLAEVDSLGSIRNERFWTTGSSDARSIDGQAYWSSFTQTVFHWKSFEENLSFPDINDVELTRVVKGGLALSHVIFAGEHPHYGGAYYGETVHDTFPPAFIAVLETAFRYGETDRAKRLIDFWFRYCVNQDGVIRYWQRDVQNAASASEYGMIYHLLEELDRAWGENWGIENYFKQLEASAHYLHSLRRPIEPGGYRLIHLGAEADNAELKQAYFSNNLWAARGLERLSQLFERYKRKGTAAQLRHMAEDIYKDTRKALDAFTVQTSYGPLPPIHPQYAALPLTLSAGLTRPNDISEETWSKYHNNESVSIPIRDREQPPQNLRENTYANYRYYLEMLSSGGLPQEMAEAIGRMRVDRGGELLGMTRFAGHLDDWPVADWGKYLLATDRLKNYWLLFYAHIAHHQDRDTLTAFEQVGIDGKYRAADCLPSQLAAARMLAWAFACEFPGDEHLYLLRGIPPEWYDPGMKFGWNDMPTNAGKLTIQVIGSAREVQIRIDFSRIANGAKPILQLNCCKRLDHWSVRDGENLIGKVKGNRMRIREGKRGILTIVVGRT